MKSLTFLSIPSWAQLKIYALALRPSTSCLPGDGVPLWIVVGTTLINLHIDDMSEVGKAPRHSKRASLEKLRRCLDRAAES